MPKNAINIIDLGTKDYKSALGLQEQTLQNLLTGTGEETIFIVEHPPTITLGARDSANKLLKDTDTIKQAGIEIFKIRRGGGATAHNPGQIVIYPIINLKNHNCRKASPSGLSVSDFVRLLENIGIEFLAALGVSCQTKKDFPGLWVVSPAITMAGSEPRTPARRSLGEVGLVSGNQHKKIASIGVQIKKWITFHGMAVNINNDLSIFDLIVPCGLDNIKMTNAQIELDKKIDIESAKEILKNILLKHFVRKNEPDYQKTTAQLA